jgi:hypothetical protein
MVGSFRVEEESPGSSRFLMRPGYWDKHACVGRTYSGKQYALVYDAKGSCGDCFRVYRLSGIGSGELYR